MTHAAFRSLLAVSLGLCVLCAPAAQAAEELVDNPGYKSWSGHKVGTAVTIESSSAIAGQTFKTEMTQKLVELTKDKAVVEVTVKINIPGAPPQPARKQTIPAKVKKAEATPGKMPEGMKGKATDKGKQKIEVAGKSYECAVWEFTGEMQGGIKMTGTSWTSEKIPGSLAKMESTMKVEGQDTKSTMKVTKIEAK